MPFLFFFKIFQFVVFIKISNLGESAKTLLVIVSKEDIDYVPQWKTTNTKEKLGEVKNRLVIFCNELKIN